METQSRLPEPPPPAQLTPIPIPDAVLRAVYASDQDMYPVALSYSRLRAWVDASPDLSICFQDSAAAVAGVIIVLPLQRRHWEDLLVGGLKEPDIEPESIVFLGDGSGGALGEKEEEVGLHVYHIERFDVIAAECGEGAERRRFSEYALAEVVKRVENRPAWKVVGMSGTSFVVLVQPCNTMLTPCY